MGFGKNCRLKRSKLTTMVTVLDATRFEILNLFVASMPQIKFPFNLTNGPVGDAISICMLPRCLKSSFHSI